MSKKRGPLRLVENQLPYRLLTVKDVQQQLYANVSLRERSRCMSLKSPKIPELSDMLSEIGMSPFSREQCQAVYTDHQFLHHLYKLNAWWWVLEKGTGRFCYLGEPDLVSESPFSTHVAFELVFVKMRMERVPFTRFLLASRPYT